MTGTETPQILRRAAVGSTNDEALAALRGGTGPLWLVADAQTAGRGRRRRHWLSLPGNLYATFGFPDALPGERAGILPLAAALALAEAIEAATGLAPSLKWPNDVFLCARKVAGILIEAEHAGASRRTVLGFGVNLAHHPEELAATHIRAHAPCEREDLFAALVGSLAHRLHVLRQPGGIARTRSDWLEGAIGLGEPLVVRLENREERGRFDGLDPLGRLILARPEGVSHISAGDVFLVSEPL